MEIAPRRCGPAPGQAREVRQRVEREVHLARRAAELVALDVLDEVGRQLASRRPASGTSGADRRSRARPSASISSPFSSTTPVAWPFLTSDAARPAPRCGSRRRPRAPRRDGVRDRAGAAAREAPGAERAVDLAHVVVQQHVRRARRAHAQERADDPRRRHRRLEHVGLEPLVEEVDGAHRHQLDLVVAGRRRAARGSAGRGTAACSRLARIERHRIGRRHVEDRLDEARHLDHRLAVLVVGLGVELRVPRDLAARLARGRSRARGSRRSASA